MLRAGLFSMLMAASVASGQGNPPARGRAERAGAPPGRGAAAAPEQGAGLLVARQAIERLVRREIQPTEAQFRQLQGIDGRYEPQRIQLNRDEQAVRVQLCQLMLDTANVDQAKIGDALDRLVRFPGRKAAILEAEQKDLSSVLSPLQRARYQAIQEKVRRQIEGGRGGRSGRGGPPAPTCSAP